MSLKKLLAALTSLVLLVGIISIPSGGTSYQPVQAKDTNSYYMYGGPVDTSIANEEKIIEMLKREGKIAQNATYEQAQKIYLKYMQNAAKENQNERPSKMDRDLKAKQNEKVQKYIFEQSNPDTDPKKVNVLVLLVDYQDYKHSSIQPEETDMYYEDYSHQHFQDMIFGDDGYVGPNGENLISMKQYYAQQSGGSLEIDGTVAGWYTLPNTAAYYGAQVGNTHDVRARNAVAHALGLAAKDPSINLGDFDKEDIYDLDGDGDLNEPDGIIDYLMVLHAGVGQEAGGGSLGSDAIWSHSWNLGGLYKIPGTNYYAYDYTIEPEDGATGVFAHEFGHNLGLPDEYDTQYTSSAGEPISYWSIMSSGSWGGTIPGAEPTGFSPYAKQIFQALYGGNWQKVVDIDYDKLSQAGARVTLRQADEEGQVVRINLPDKKGSLIVKPNSGNYSYFSRIGNNIDNSMITSLDLTNVDSPNLTFKAWYDIEEDWDYASVQVKSQGSEKWVSIEGNITTTSNPNDQNPGYGITGTSDGWVDAQFDLTQFKGQIIELKFNYWTDGAAVQKGLFVDGIVVKSGDTIVLSDDAEETSKFTFEGFVKSDGYLYTARYYLVEWRNHHGVDTSLAHVGVLGQNLSYDPGMVVWYVDDSYIDNWTGVHPGEGYLGIVDADQNSIVWKFADGKTAPLLASGRYQMHDAAFSMKKEAEMTINTDKELGRSPVDTYMFTESKFSDKTNYLNKQIPSLGRNIPKYGISIEIANQANDNSSATLIIKK